MVCGIEGRVVIVVFWRVFGFFASSFSEEVKNED